jgi:hypothetical protein
MILNDDPKFFLDHYSNIDWFKKERRELNGDSYISLFAKKYIDKNSALFLSESLSKEPWANTPIESIGGKTWVEYAESIQKKSGYNKNSLTKLSRALNNLGLNNYVYAVEKLHKY